MNIVNCTGAVGCPCSVTRRADCFSVYLQLYVEECDSLGLHFLKIQNFF